METDAMNPINGLMLPRFSGHTLSCMLTLEFNRAEVTQC